MTEGATRTGLEAFLQREAAVGTLTVPTLAALLVGVAHLSQTYALYLALGPAYLEQIDLLIIFGLYRLLEGVFLWGAFTATIYLVSIPFGGTPLFGHVVRVVGWGLLPFVPAAIIWAAGRYYALRAVAYPDWEPFGMEQEWAKLTEYTDQTAADPVLVGSTLLGCGVLLVSAHIWITGVTTACDLDRRRAGIVVAIPLGLYAGWKILGVLGV